MPFKVNADRRHHIPRQRQKITNWAEYDAGLRARGSLTVWFTAKAIEGWRAEARTGRGGQAKYSDLAIATALTLRAVFRSRATATLAGRIASPEMLPERGLLPHLKCSPGARRSGGGNEAGEHGDA
jgi:hypothetical protein